MDDIKYPWLWPQGSGCYELLKVGDDLNDYESWTQGSRCYEQLKVMDDKNDQGRELKTLDAINNLVLWRT